MYNVDVSCEGKIVLCKAFTTKQAAMRFVNTIKDGICFGCHVVLLKREDNGEYIEINNWIY